MGGMDTDYTSYMGGGGVSNGKLLTESSSRKASHGKLHTDGRSFLSLHLTLSRLAVRCSYLFGLRSEG
ncbi:hypothetical protein POVWA1_039350 [Plasmodium ovale wallikeri]|uniref:Uncharacterized protein n=1 Tax=Plasmodium ovale wallikeri TaxID=864142 RepID=A0A1A8Z5P8_PLAOA|nr:hypothetical protein POVWA1_039350 [Plasmodium ovale wallikeri]